MNVHLDVAKAYLAFAVSSARTAEELANGALKEAEKFVAKGAEVARS